MALIDFTLSNARRFYSSMGNPLGVKGLINIVLNFLKISINFASFRIFVSKVCLIAFIQNFLCCISVTIFGHYATTSKRKKIK